MNALYLYLLFCGSLRYTEQHMCNVLYGDVRGLHQYFATNLFSDHKFVLWRSRSKALLRVYVSDSNSFYFKREITKEFAQPSVHT